MVNQYTGDYMYGDYMAYWHEVYTDIGTKCRTAITFTVSCNDCFVKSFKGYLMPQERKALVIFIFHVACVLTQNAAGK